MAKRKKRPVTKVKGMRLKDLVPGSLCESVRQPDLSYTLVAYEEHYRIPYWERDLVQGFMPPGNRFVYLGFAPINVEEIAKIDSIYNMFPRSYKNIFTIKALYKEGIIYITGDCKHLLTGFVVKNL